MFLKELFEAPAKKAVLAFGRLNPPTIGHEKLVDQIKKYEGDHYLFLSQTQKPKTDPLDFATKLKFAKQSFPGINVGHQSVRTPVQALEMLQGLGYTDLIFVAGSDRVDGFQKMFDTYNGKPDKSGKIPFEFNTLKVVSAGERDPDAEGAEGMSASKMRLAAAEGNLEAFAQGVPATAKKLAKAMYDAVRKGMGVKDEVPAQEGIRPEKPSKSSEELIAMGYAPDSDKVQRAREYEDWADDQRAKGKEIDEILGFAKHQPKRAVIKKRYKQPEDDSVQDKLKKRRAMAAKGDDRAFKSGGLNDDAPPGREKQVKKLKKKFDDPGAPYAIAWAQHNKHGKPSKKK